MHTKRSIHPIWPLPTILALCLAAGCSSNSTTADSGGITADKGVTGDSGATADKGASADGGVLADKGAAGDGKPAADKGTTGDGGGGSSTGTIQGTFEGTAFSHTCSWTGWHADNRLSYTSLNNGVASIYCAELKNGVASGPKVQLELRTLHPTTPAAALPATFDYTGKDPMGHYHVMVAHAGVSNVKIMSINTKNLKEISAKGNWSSDGKNGHFVVEVRGKWGPGTLSSEAEGDFTAKFDVWMPKK